MKKSYFKKIIVKVFITIVLCLINIGNIYAKQEIPQAVKGVIDLTKYDFKQVKSIKLSGEWEFYRNQLLTPKDFKY